MNKVDIKNLATLARIELSPEETENFTKEVSSILDYVSVVQDLAGDTADEAPKLGARYNVFRQDEVTNEADFYTKDILAEMPKTEGRYMVVKKILNPDS